MNRPSGTLNSSYAQDMAIVRTRLQWILLVAGIILLFCLPLFASSYWLSVLNIIGISVIAVLGLNMLSGYCGQISLGHAAFIAVGAYTSAILTTRFALPFWIALPCAGLATGVVGLIFGLPSLRIKGFYIAMATLAAQFVIIYIAAHWRSVTGGTDGMVVPPPRIGNLILNSEGSMFIVIMSIAVMMTFFAKNLARSRIGRAWVAVRDNDIAAEVMGINLFKYKLLAFFVASVYAGIAGSLWAHYMRAINPEHFPLMQSIWYLGMVIIGGLGSIAGAVFGAVFMTLLEQLVIGVGPAIGSIFPSFATVTSLAFSSMVFGLVIALFLIFEPRGLAHRWELFKAGYRFWPYSY